VQPVRDPGANVEELKQFRVIDTGDDRQYSYPLTKDGETIATGNIQERCLISWDDSFQVHSVRTIVRWNYQAVKTRMKKLHTA
jgi:hypothetical protein